MKKSSKHFENSAGVEGLRVNEGIPTPSPVDDQSVQRFLERTRRSYTAGEYVEAILKGNITMLSRAVTLVESARPEHQAVAREIVAQCLPHSGKSLRVGITGVPGAGKSTFIEALGKMLTARGNRLAVLAIDPSSAQSMGSILGDKTRMEELSSDPNAYIRPSPAAGSLGGVARKTRETVVLCEAAGFDTIFIETVGVGQSETAVHSMTDLFLLLMLAGAGDELQGIKRGIMEMADLVAINKADGQNIEKAQAARVQYHNALHLFPMKVSGWDPQVMTCSSTEKQGIAEIWDAIIAYRDATIANGWFMAHRHEQSRYWLFEAIEEQLKSGFYHHPAIKPLLSGMESRVVNAEISPFEAARQLLSIYKG